MSTENIEEVREKSRAIVARIKSDPAFRAQAEQDPRGTLVAAGLSETAAEDLTVELSKSGEVQGFCTTTCKTSCYSTCLLTIIEF